MNNFFVLSAILFFSSTVTSFRLPSDDAPNDDLITLQKICQPGVFPYNGIFVNSFYAKKFNFTFEPVAHFAFEEELEFSEYFENQETADQVFDIKDEYNNIVVNVYSEEYVNTRRLQSIEYYMSRMQQLKEKMGNYSKDVIEKNKTKFTALLSTFDRGVNFLKTLLIFKDNTIQPITMELSKFKSFISNLKFDEENHIFAFKNDPIVKMYKRQLVKIDRFYFNRASKQFYDFRSNGTVEYSINLPFHSKKYNQTDCIRGETLPPFFSKKTTN